MHSFCASESVSLPDAGLSSRSLLRGTQGGRVYSRRKIGPGPGSVARTLGVQSRAKLAKQSKSQNIKLWVTG